MDLALARPIRVYACDIDGCLARPGHAAFDLGRLRAIADLNRASLTDGSVPALTLVTGRPHAYVDAIMQALDVRLPASFENGAGVATRHPYRATLATEVEAHEGEVQRLTSLLAERDDVFLQLGKVASFSVFPIDPSRDVRELADTLAGLLREHELRFDVDASTDCVNLLLPGVDKPAGVRAMCAAADVPLGAVAGIGDMDGDLAWLRLCAVSFAPSNAVAEVREAVTYALPLPDVAATLDAYERLVAANRAFAVS